MVTEQRAAELKRKAPGFKRWFDNMSGAVIPAQKRIRAAEDYQHGNVQHLERRRKRIAFFGLDAKPVLATHAARAKSVEEAKALLAKDLHPTGDLYNSPATKLHLAGVLLSRAWNTLSKSH